MEFDSQVYIFGHLIETKTFFILSQLFSKKVLLLFFILNYNNKYKSILHDKNNEFFCQYINFTAENNFKLIVWSTFNLCFKKPKTHYKGT